MLETFVKSLVGVGSTVNKYYAFLGLPNSTQPKQVVLPHGTNTPASFGWF